MKDYRKFMDRLRSILPVGLFILLIFFVFFLTIQSDMLRKMYGWKRILLMLLLSAVLIAVYYLAPLVKKHLEKSHVLSAGTGIVLWVITPPAFFVLSQLLLGEDWAFQKKYLLSSLILYYLVLCVVTLLFRKVRTAVLLYGILSIVLSVVNYILMDFRGKPLTIFDIWSIRTAAEVASKYSIHMQPKEGILLLSGTIFLTAAVRLQTLVFPVKPLWKRCVRLLACLGSFALLITFCRIQFPKSYVTAGQFWRLNDTYAERGFWASMAAEFHYLKAEMPEGYSAEILKQIEEKYSAEAEEKTAQSGESVKPENIQPVNIIVIMNESLADLESIGKIEASEEIMPYLHSLQKNPTVKTGWLHAPVFGGGTADTEYEFLTGNSKAFMPKEMIAYEVYCQNPEYGLASVLHDQGYETIAMHPSLPTNWNRTRVFDQMRFDVFYSGSNWYGEKERIRTFVSDKACYDSIISQFEEKPAGQKRFTFCITMQNHGGYTDDTLKGYEPIITLNGDHDYPRATNYLSLMKESDTAFKSMIEYFEQVEEPTMILLFGDHQIQLEDDFLNALFGKPVAQMNSEENQMRYITPYVLWTNYDSAALQKTIIPADISANYLGSYLLKAANLQDTIYNRLLYQTSQAIPVLGIGDLVMLADGSWQSMDTLEDPQKQLLKEYQIVEYNNVFDHNGKIDALFQ